MNNFHPFTELLSGGMVRSICWTLLHSLWEGLACALIAAAMLSQTRKSRAALRYQLLLLVFMCFVLSVTGTFILEQNSRPGNVNLAGQLNPAQINAETLPWPPGIIQTGPGAPAKVSAWFSENAPFIVTVWALVIFLKLAYLSFSLGYTRVIRRRHAQDPAAHWKDKLKALTRRLGIGRQVALLETARIQVPVVFGYLKPVIFVPIGMLAALSAAQVEAILLHELAHIRRHDYLVNLLQYIVETLFFFNPALRWLSTVIRDERENCCDELAIRETGDPKQFVAALIGVREYTSFSPTLSVGFPGRKGSLVNRVARIVHHRNSGVSGAEKSWLLLGCVAALALLFFFNKPLAGQAQGQPGDSRPTSMQQIKKAATPAVVAAYKRTHARSVQDTKGGFSQKDTTNRPDADVNVDKQRIRNIIIALHRERVVTATDSLTWFGLDAGQFVVNGQKQPEELHQKFVKEFRIEEGHGLYYGSVQVTGTGSFFDKTDLQ